MAYNVPQVAPYNFGSLTLAGISLAGIAWAIPGAATDLLGVSGFRVPAFLAYATEWRVVGQLTAAAGAGAVFSGLYSTTAAGALVTLGAGNLAADVLGVGVGAWTTLPAGAKGDVFVTVQGSGGNGVTAAVLAFLAIQVR